MYIYTDVKEVVPTEGFSATLTVTTFKCQWKRSVCVYIHCIVIVYTLYMYIYSCTNYAHCDLLCSCNDFHVHAVQCTLHVLAHVHVHVHTVCVVGVICCTIIQHICVHVHMYCTCIIIIIVIIIPTRAYIHL